MMSVLDQKSSRGAREGRWELERSNRSKIWNESYRMGTCLLGERLGSGISGRENRQRHKG